MKKTLKLTPPKLAFIVGTRIAFAAGVGLLASAKLPDRIRRIIGFGLVGIGAITTVPALRTLSAAAH